MCTHVCNHHARAHWCARMVGGGGTTVPHVPPPPYPRTPPRGQFTRRPHLFARLWLATSFARHARMSAASENTRPARGAVSTEMSVPRGMFGGSTGEGVQTSAREINWMLITPLAFAFLPLVHYALRCVRNAHLFRSRACCSSSARAYTLRTWCAASAVYARPPRLLPANHGAFTKPRPLRSACTHSMCTQQRGCKAIC